MGDESEENYASILWNSLNSLKRINQTPEYNVLLLGETGAGKSTTINAWANYMKFEEFDDARNGEFEKLIPSKFKLGQTEINCGTTDANEQPGQGASSTQSPAAYTFRFRDKVIRIIDTPGIGDTREEAVDQENFRKILAHLNNYQHLHGILILLKSNQTRTTPFFRYCITQLLSHLHKSASDNLFFCFTFSRASFFKPSDGFTTLETFLRDDLPSVKIQLQFGENCFFIDNDSFRFLVARKKGYKFQNADEKNYQDSWDNSAKQSKTMWEKIVIKKPHELAETISLNSVKNLIFEMAEPMVRLQAMVQSNRAHIQTQTKLLEQSTHSKDALQKLLDTEVDSLKPIQLDYPITVCTNDECTEQVKLDDGTIDTNYKTECHRRCYLDNVGVNAKGHELLRKCSAMNVSGTCINCDCPWDKHMHVRMKYKTVKRKIFDPATQNKIQFKTEKIESFKAGIILLKETAKEYKEEYETIQDVCTRFAYILVNNLNVPINNFIIPYLDLLMEQERRKIDRDLECTDENYLLLKKMKETHKENARILKQAIDNKEEEEIKLEDTYKYLESLFKLKHTGKDLKNILEKTKAAKQNQFDQIPEKGLDLTQIEPKTDKPSFWRQFWFF